jgi:anaerobic magnesium-protoporphyrin IX monomethyl ester cyclase
MLLGRVATAGKRPAPRVLFIKARVENHRSTSCAPALGILYLAAVARECGWEAYVVDAYLEDDPEQAVRDAIARLDPQLIGISALTSESKSMHELAAVARRGAPDALLLAGGPHPSAYADEVLDDPAIDGIVIGEGELTFHEILERLSFGRPWKDVSGIALRAEDGSVKRNPARPYIEDLDTLPQPAWDLTDLDAYAKRRGQALVGMRRYMPIMTSRGCPYKCTYCHDIQGKRFRSHSPEYVLGMIDALGRSFGVHQFDIVDDIFNFDAERMLAICAGFTQRKRAGRPIGFALPNGIRADRLTPELVDRLAEAGCEYAAIAIETATKRLQKQIRKHLRFDKVLPVIEAFHRNQIFTCGFFMLGFPSETEEDLRATIEFAVRSKLHAAFFFVVTPFQGTELHHQVAETVGQDLTRALTRLYACQKINLSDVPDSRFFQLRRRAHFAFYFHPRRIAGIWRTFPRPRYLPELVFVMLARDTLRLQPGVVLEPLARLRAKALRWLRPPRSEPMPSGWRPIPPVLRDERSRTELVVLEPGGG